MRISDWSSDVCSSDLIEPDKPAHRVAFGHNLRAAGEVEAAIASYRKAATLDYEFGEAWWSLASIKRKVLTDADVTEIRKGIAVAIDVRNSAPLHFALARALPDPGPHAASFVPYPAGNRPRAEALGYDARALTASHAALRKAHGR